MSRRRPSRHPSNESRAELALGELCAKLGYCLDQDGRKAILSTPPADAEAFVDAVIIAEGRHLLAVDKEERRPMLDIVTKWAVYQDSAG